MARSDIEKEIEGAMANAGVNLSKEMLSKCMALSLNLQLSPSVIASQWELHSINNSVTTLDEHTFKSFRTHIMSSRKLRRTPRSTSNDAIVSPVPFKQGAVIHRAAMGKRTNPDSDNTHANPVTVSSPSSSSNNNNKGIKRKVDFDSQLEHVVSTNNGVSSPLALSSQSSAIVTPAKGSSTTSSSKATSPNLEKAYNERKNAGQTIIKYNPNNLPSLNGSAITQSTNSIQITKPYSMVESYKYMSDKDRSYALNSQLTSFQNTIMENIRHKAKLMDNDTMTTTTATTSDETEQDLESLFEFVGVPRQGTQFNIGRICNESHEGKMNKTTILLEGSKNGSNGARIALDVSKLNQSYSLFPGQIVGVKGINSSGRKMVVEEIIEGLDLIKSVKEEVVTQSSTNNSKGTTLVNGDHGVKVFVSAGPYTTNHNLDYQPMIDLLVSITQDKPAVVIMMGPFVDVRQYQLKDGDQVVVEYELEDGRKISRHVSYETLFVLKISQVLEGLYEQYPDLNTKFILVPSLDDGVAEPVFPQPPMADSMPDGGIRVSAFPESDEFPFGSLCLENIETAGDRKVPKNEADRRIHLVSNPSTIKINDVTIGMTSTDTLLHLSTEEINHKLPPGTRLSRLAEHCIQQQSYYPVYPAPALPGLSVNLDVNMRSGYSMPAKPDILLIPSRLTCFAKDVIGGTVVVNPGHLVKGAMGGSFAVIDIHPVSSDENNKGGNNVKDRVRVDIKKI